MSPFEPVDIDQLLDEHDRLHSRSTGSRNWEVADQGADYMASDLGASVPSADEAAEEPRLDTSEAHPDADRVEGPQSSNFTDSELADFDPNFSYGPAGEPRTRADASSEWVTDPDWDGTDIFAGPDHEPPAEVWEQWEKAAARGDEEPTLHGPYASSEQSDAAWDAAMAEHDITFTSERPAELDEQVGQAREALGQLADDSPSAGRPPAASTSDDTDARER